MVWVARGALTVGTGAMVTDGALPDWARATLANKAKAKAKEKTNVEG